MKRWGRNNLVLGLALEERAINAVELNTSGERARIVRQARMEMTDEMSWERPAELGAALREFLDTNGFTARSTVAGLPGRWLLARPQVVPPTDERTVAGLLRLTIERDFPGNGQEWAFDAAGRPSGESSRTLLLVVAPRPRLNAVTAMLQHAELEAAAISCTALALASVRTAGDGSDRNVLVMTPDGVELMIVRNEQVHAAERLAVATLSAQALAAEVQRVEAVAGTSAGHPPQLIVWNTAAVADGVLKELGEKLGVTVQINPAPTEFTGATGDPSGAIAGAALAWSATAGDGAVVDFLHSRLTAPPPARITRRRALIATAGVVVLGAALYLVGDWYAQRRAVESLTQQLTAMKSDVASARTGVDHLRLVREWYESRPPMLECLRALTLAFPGSGQVWASSLSLRDDMTGTLTGKAVDEKTAIELMDRLKTSGVFTTVKLQQLRSDTHGVSFAITFLFTPAEESR